ncbi:MAG: hypothetical protein ACLR17_21795 [Enterobacteriaceae bacterium]
MAFTTTEPLKNATQALALYSRATRPPGLPGKRREYLLAASCGKPSDEVSWQARSCSFRWIFQRYWLGVLAMDFSVQEMKTFLVTH